MLCVLGGSVRNIDRFKDRASDGVVQELRVDVGWFNRPPIWSRKTVFNCTQGPKCQMATLG
jgi:hypothetical protein